jgi:hypothetical protein
MQHEKLILLTSGLNKLIFSGDVFNIFNIISVFPISWG